MTKEEILEPYRQYTQPLSFGLLAADLVSGDDALKAMQQYADQQVEAAFQSARQRTTTTNGMIHFDSGDTTPHYPFLFPGFNEFKKSQSV